jgi:hypothetical protein
VAKPLVITAAVDVAAYNGAPGWPRERLWEEYRSLLRLISHSAANAREIVGSVLAERLREVSRGVHTLIRAALESGDAADLAAVRAVLATLTPIEREYVLDLLTPERLEGLPRLEPYVYRHHYKDVSLDNE